MATIIHVAVSTDLMTNPGVIDVPAIKHICLVGNNRPWVHDTLILRSGHLAASRRMGDAYSWSETREYALLTMRTDRKPREIPAPC
jgi:hypothetical protein